jgi:hypothetical protein
VSNLSATVTNLSIWFLSLSLYPFRSTILVTSLIYYVIKGVVPFIKWRAVPWNLIFSLDFIKLYLIFTFFICYLFILVDMWNPILIYSLLILTSM